MKQIRTIAFNTCRLIFKSGTGWGILLTSAAIASFIFSQAQADGVLVNELRLRLRYSLSFAFVFLSLCMLFISCLSVRRDIDLKIMHVLTAHPLPRYRIWLGKWLGCLLFSVIAVASTMVVVLLCAVLYGHGHPLAAGKGVLPVEFRSVYRVVQPDLPSLEGLVDEEIARQRRQGKTFDDMAGWQIREKVRDQIRREEQLIVPDGFRSWEFHLGRVPANGDEVLLEYCFFARDQRRPVKGFWGMEPVDAVGRFAVPVEAFPYTTQRLRLPTRLVPPSGKIRITFKGENSPYLIFARGKGVKVLLTEGTFTENAVKACVFMVLHLAAVIAAGLALAVPLTFPVASFSCLVIYLVAIASPFFAGIVQELSFGEPSRLKTLFQAVLCLGVWLSQGLYMPPVLSPLAEGRSIQIGELWYLWGTGYILFLLTASFLGMYWLSRKEIDRIH